MDNYIVGFYIFEKWSHDAGDANASDSLNWASHLNMLASALGQEPFLCGSPRIKPVIAGRLVVLATGSKEGDGDFSQLIYFS